MSKKTFWGMIIFFLTNMLTIQTAVLIFSYVREKTADNFVIAIVMIAVGFALSLLFTLVDYLRRKHTEEKPTHEILSATERIANGDFKVRIPIEKDYEHFDQYDLIKENINLLASALSESEMLKSDFISSVSHELKTPLAVMENYATLLLNEDLEESERKEYAGVLVKTSKRLAKLVSNILKLNRLENSTLAIKKEKFNLTSALGECILRYEDKMDDKGIILDCDFDDCEIVSNREYLDIVFSNLMSNAVKFTERGGEIVVTLKKTDEGAVVSFQDTGCGISSQSGEKIFEKFYQADNSHAVEGNGLGLALVKRVIDALAGEIKVSSALGEGSTFTVTIRDDEQ